jgi:Right handed beta helix region
LKARLLAVGVSLALIAFGGTASALVLHLGLISAHTAAPSEVRPSETGPSETGPSETGPSETGPSETGPSETGPAETGAPGATQVPGDCITTPSACGFPDGTNTGVPRGIALRSVPGQVSSGPGWYYDAAGKDVIVTGNGTVLSGLYIPYNLVINASNVTVQDVRVVTGGYFGISLTHTRGVTIEDSTISGQNSTTGRVGYAIDDVYGDSTGIVIKNNNISRFKTGVQVSTGLIAGNYIHAPGYIHGDHTNGIFVAGGTEPLTIYGNTIFNDLGQTDDISLDASSSGQDVANKTVVDNLLAGGGYSIYGGGARNDRTSNIVIEDNEFGRLYYPEGGRYGPAAYVDLRQAGNVWSGNVWSGTSAVAAAG